MPKKQRSPKIVYRKLGKERAWGQATHDERSPLIEIDPRLGAKRQLEVLIHEASHLAIPEASEGKIDAIGKYICDVLWKQNYRRVLLDKNSQPPKIS
jgi:hypothetical protein